MIEWFARNHVAANLLMVGILITGLITINRDVALELMPDFNLDTITINTVLPGGNPRSIEETITSRVEEAIADIEGIEKVTSRSSEGISSVFAQVEAGYDNQAILSDVKIRVDALNTLPLDAERPVIQLAEGTHSGHWASNLRRRSYIRHTISGCGRRPRSITSGQWGNSGGAFTGTSPRNAY